MSRKIQNFLYNNKVQKFPQHFVRNGTLVCHMARWHAKLKHWQVSQHVGTFIGTLAPKNQKLAPFRTLVRKPRWHASTLAQKPRQHADTRGTRFCKLEENYFLMPATQISTLKQFNIKTHKAISKKHFLLQLENNCEEEINLAP